MLLHNICYNFVFFRSKNLNLILLLSHKLLNFDLFFLSQGIKIIGIKVNKNFFVNSLFKIQNIYTIFHQFLNFQGYMVTFNFVFLINTMPTVFSIIFMFSHHSCLISLLLCPQTTLFYPFLISCFYFIWYISFFIFFLYLFFCYSSDFYCCCLIQ